MYLINLLWSVLVVGGSAHAHPTSALPEISLGGNPYHSFSGNIAPGTTVSLIDVPADQEFIVTMVTTAEAEGSFTASGVLQDDGIRILQDTTVVLSGGAINEKSAFGPLNNGRLRIQSGTRLAIESGAPTSPNAAYHVQGYFVQAPSPYRSVDGVTPRGSGSIYPLFTNTESQDFMVRTVILHPEGGGAHGCDLYMDGELLIGGSSQFLLPSTGRSTLPKGIGTVRVPPDSLLQVWVDSGKYCQFYVDGKYITP